MDEYWVLRYTYPGDKVASAFAIFINQKDAIVAQNSLVGANGDDVVLERVLLDIKEVK